MIRRLCTLIAIALIASTAQATLPYFGSIEIRGLDRTSRVVNEMMGHFGEMDAIDLAQQVADMLGLPSLPGVDRDGTVRMDLYLVNGFADEPAFRISIPRPENDDAFIEVLKNLWPEHSEAGDMLILSASPTQPSPIPIQELFIRTEPNAIHIANLAGVLPLSTTTLDPVEGVIALGIHPPTIADAMKAQMQQQEQMMREMFGHMSPEEMAKMGIDLDQQQSHQKMALAILRAFQQIALSLDLGPKALQIQSLIAPTPNTPLAEFVNSMQPPAPRFVSIFPPDAIWAQVMNFEIPDSMIDLYLNFFRSVASDVADDDGQTLAFMEQSLDMLRGLYAGDVAIMVQPAKPGDKLPVHIAQVWRVQDVEASRATMRKSIELAQQHITTTLPEQEDAVELLEPRTHRDVTIEGYAMDLAMGDPQVDMMLSMYAPALGRMGVEYAFIEDVMLSVMGSQEAMNELIDRYLDGAQDLREFPAVQTLFLEIPRDAVDLVLVQPVELLHMLRRAAPMLPMEWLQDLTEGKMAIAAYSRRLEGNKIHSVTHLDLMGLIETVGGVQQSISATREPTLYHDPALYEWDAEDVDE